MAESEVGKKGMDSAAVVLTTQNYIRESNEAKKTRIDRNQENFDVFHQNQDYSHKNEGQSQEFLPKQTMAVEQLSSFIQQGLVDLGDFFSVEAEPGNKDEFITPEEVRLLTNRQLKKASFLQVVGDAIKSGALGSLMILKVGGRTVARPRFYTQDMISDSGRVKKSLFKEDRMSWQLNLELIRQQDFHIDPTGSGLYRGHDIYVDYWEVEKLARGDNPLYDLSVVEKLTDYSEDQPQESKYNRIVESGQSKSNPGYRKRIKLTEMWGNIIDDQGSVVHENVTWTVANDQFLIQKPQMNPHWSGEDPYVVAPLVRVPFSVWHRALMDGPTRHNVAINELFNLILDSGMMATHGIKQIRTDWLEDTSEVANGIRPAQTLRVNSSCPPGGQVLERVDTASLSSESLAVFNLLNAEFNSSALTNDLRMGVLPQRAVKATEVVEASQTITSIFTGIAKVIEEGWIEKTLDKSWMLTMQNADDLDSDEVRALLGQSRALKLASVSAEDRFAKTVMGHKFRVFGVSQTLNKMQDFRKLVSMLQTIGASPLLQEEFMKKYSFGKLLDEVMRSLDINTARLQVDEEEAMLLAMAQMGGGMGPAQQGGPDMQSQIPQASAGAAIPDRVQQGIPRSTFPGSPALAGRGNQ